MYRLSEITQRNLEYSLGIKLEELGKMSTEEEREWIEEKAGKKICFSKKRKYGVVGRGNPLLARRKIRTIDDVDRKSREFYGI